MNVVDVITWTCACVFICTAIITLLAVVNVIQIESSFREKLFYALLIEVVACSVLVFKNKVSPAATNLIRITNPTEVPSQTNLTRGKDLYVFGVCQKQDDAVFEGKIEVDNKSFKLNNFKIGNHDVFTANTDLNADTTLGIRDAKVIVKLTIKGELASADSVTFKLASNN